MNIYSDYEKLDMANEVSIIGTLAYNRNSYPRIGRNYYEPVTITNDFKSSNIVFFIEPVSMDTNFARNINVNKLPKDIVDDIKDLYIGFDNQHFNSDIDPFGQFTSENAGYLSKTPEEKREIVFDALKNKLILFKANIQPSNSFGDIDYNKNLIIQEILEDKFIENAKYKTIPEVSTDDASFEFKLYSKKPVKLEYYNHEMLENPEAIIYGDFIYFVNKNNWEKVDGTYDEWIYNGDIDTIEKKNFYIEEEYYEQGYILEIVPEYVYIEEEFFYEKFKTEKKVIVKEISFLNNLKQLTDSKGLDYDFEEIVNLHVSIKTNPLTIISGMSGTGKSQLALSYIKTMGCFDDNRFLFIPISPSYIEPKDVLGYFDSKTNNYIPSETGLVDLLIEASKNPEKLYFVIFDEMNLSQVEYWFSPFISLLELKENKVLKLFSEKLKCTNNYPSKITLNDNIRFIGTVNLDETTKEFSDRLLDRANLVSLKRKSLRSFRQKIKEEGIKEVYENNEYNYFDYKSWINEGFEFLTDDEIEFLDKLHELLESSDSNKGVSPRTCSNIENYIKNIPFDEEENLLISRRKAFDIQIKQRVLTKIKGSSSQLQEIINQINSPIINLFDEYSVVSDFDSCKEDISRKLKELNLYGYTN